jgi:hypothetical protein
MESSNLHTLLLLIVAASGVAAVHYTNYYNKKPLMNSVLQGTDYVRELLASSDQKLNRLARMPKTSFILLAEFMQEQRLLRISRQKITVEQ